MAIVQSIISLVAQWNHVPLSLAVGAAWFLLNMSIIPVWLRRQHHIPLIESERAGYAATLGSFMVVSLAATIYEVVLSLSYRVAGVLTPYLLVVIGACVAGIYLASSFLMPTIGHSRRVPFWFVVALSIIALILGSFTFFAPLALMIHNRSVLIVALMGAVGIMILAGMQALLLYPLLSNRKGGSYKLLALNVCANSLFLALITMYIKSL